jgi:putative FmdB family regulatory protein
MPTYDYRCPNGHEFEHFFRKISDAQATWVCPVCGEAAQRMVSGGAGLLFKGSGFYITDYGKDGKKSERERSKDTSASSKGSGGDAPASNPSAGSTDKGSGSSPPPSTSTTPPPAKGTKGE